MIIKDDFKNENGCWKANEGRVSNINKNKHSEFPNKITKQMYEVNDINKLQQLLEDKLFYEKTPEWAVEKLYNSIQQGVGLYKRV